MNHSQSSWPCQIRGSDKDPPLIFLHGFMGMGADWERVASLCADQFYCLMPDLPGHGQNIHRSFSERLTFDLLAEELILSLDHWNLEAVNLVGYSMGGRIALYTALKFPQRIKMLVLEGANPGLADSEARKTRAALDDQRAETLLKNGLDSFLKNWYQLDLFQTLKNDPLLLEQTIAKRKQNRAKWMAKVIRELSPGRQPSLWKRLQQLPLSVLLVAGEHDTKYSSLMRKMAAQIPQASLEIILQAGHNTHLEHPQRFGERIIAFLQSHHED